MKHIHSMYHFSIQMPVRIPNRFIFHTAPFFDLDIFAVQQQIRRFLRYILKASVNRSVCLCSNNPHGFPIVFPHGIRNPLCHSGIAVPIRQTDRNGFLDVCDHLFPLSVQDSGKGQILHRMLYDMPDGFRCGCR